MRRARECQSKVAKDAMIMTATRAAMGMSETTGQKTMHSNQERADLRVDHRLADHGAAGAVMVTAATPKSGDRKSPSLPLTLVAPWPVPFLPLSL
ncbi:hypothetical protein BGK67_34340 [Streptomyces subrutilus]|uniref:Uncharacterized protein n=1 Tax=Streptomyces subrutilus TaxID=36818 RepID=A0A1E5P0M6_9ACTN|nr:hypothetical protein BGK67_34340 [Streptomyces subrutilus]